MLFLRMGRWEEADTLLRQSYESSRDLRTLENRLGSQLGRARLLALRGSFEEAADVALDAMEVARAAGYVRRHVQGLLLLGEIAIDAGQNDEALESLKQAEDITASVLCRRRLPVIMVRLKMAQTLKAAVTFVEQGQVRVGPHVVTDPAFLVTKAMEDYVTWVDTSKVRRTVQKYNDKLDDFDLL